ncbi:hypothetical protein ABW21_db0203888 [Orbilia brochopaga]|nr:hypothetical protein ABW21_db0203888 [Drechslerella brochopaga]
MRLRHGLSMATKLLTVVCLLFSSSFGPAYGQHAFCNEAKTVNSQAELDLIRACVTLNGDLTLGSNLKSAVITGIQIIRGNLNAVNQTDLKRIAAPNLSYIDGSLRVTDAPTLYTLDIPNLAYLGSIHLENLPMLESFNTSTQVYPSTTSTSTDIIVRSTGIDNINSILFKNSNVVQLVDNPRIANINLSHVGVGSLLEIRNNGQDAFVSLNQLSYARSIILEGGIRDISLPALTRTLGDIILTNNTYSALEIPKLESLGQDFGDHMPRLEAKLVIDGSSSPNLRTVAFPLLGMVMNNLTLIRGSSNWSGVQGFPVLKQVGQDISIDGNFTTIELPQLDRWYNTSLSVNAAVSCHDFVKQPGIAHKNFTKLVCNGMEFNTTADTGKSGSTGDGTQGAGMPMGVKAGIGVGVAGVIGLAISAAFYHCRRTGRRWLWTTPAHKNASELSGDVFKAEMDDDRMRPELSDGRNSPAELDDGTMNMRPELEGSGFIAELDGTPKLSPTTSQLEFFESTIPEIGQGLIH